ncbi:MAG: permease-like cell division protein FtsX [Pontibacterium sp.]
MAKSGERKRGAVRTEPTLNTKPQTTQTPRKGAQRHKIRFIDQWHSWTKNHLEVAAKAYHKLWSTPLATIMTLAVLAISLALPGALFAGLKNLQQLSINWGAEPRISLYLHTEVEEQAAERLSRQLLLRDDLAAVELVSPEQGLLEFRQATGMDDVLQYLAGNPLPAVILALPVKSNNAALGLLEQQLQALPEVEEAVLDMAWVQRLSAFIMLTKRAVLVFGSLLAMAVLLVVGNSIRLAIENRRDEIVVAKLVGATNAWVRRPFLYTGIWFGLLGGVFAWVLIQISLLLIEQPVDRLVTLYESSFEVQGLGWMGSLVLVLTSTLLGFLGAWLAVGRHLREIEPH